MSSTALRRDLRSVFIEGVLWSFMVGLGETWFSAFALAMGLSAVWAGLVTTIPVLAGAHLQLLSPRLVERVRSRRKATVTTAMLQSLALAPLLFGAATGRLPGIVLFVAASVYWGAGQGAGTIWNAWMTQVIPRGVRHRFFARRSLAVQLGMVFGLVAGGFGLQAAEKGGRVLSGFLLMFALAALCRMGSAFYLSRTRERAAQGRDQVVAWRALLGRVRSGGDGRLILFLVLMTGAVTLASPYFTPFMLGPLGFSYGQYMTLIAASFLSKAVALSMLGTLARRFGAGRMLAVGAAMVTGIPLLWTFNGAFGYVLALQVASGMAWATYEFSAFLLYLDSLKEEERTSLLTTLNLASAVAGVGGSALAGVVLGRLGGSVSAYHTLFATSCVVRGAVAFLLIGLTVRRVPVPAVVFRVLSLRPSAGSIMRPIWASLKLPGRRTAIKK